MTWLAWRQLRSQVMVAAGLLAVVAAALALTGPHLVHAYRSLVLPCAQAGDCDAVVQSYIARYPLLRDLTPALAVLPLLTGMFWGAPLIARELETGTFRLAWTQSVGRTRWLAVKVAVVGLASVAVTGLATLMVGWWSGPLDAAGANRFGVGLFGERGVAPLGYAAFAFALGVAAGLVIRRTLPAMAAAVALFVAARMGVAFFLRQHFMPPRHASVPFSLGGSQPSAGANAWVLAQSTIDKAGHVIGSNGNIGFTGGLTIGQQPGGGITIVGAGSCPNLTMPAARSGQQGMIQQCLHQLGIRNLVAYHPASRYWAFQWREMGLFLLLALLLLGLCFWWVRRRPA